MARPPYMGGEALHWYKGSSGLLRRFRDHVAGLSESAIRERGSFSVVLSGASLISTLSKLTKEPYLTKIDWSKWHVFWADDRVVPLDHPDSNYKSLSDGLLSQVSIPARQVYTLNDKLSPQTTAVESYESVLMQLAKTQAFPLAQTGDYPRFDLILVGTEHAGHVASLFTHPPLVHEKQIWTRFSIEDSSQPHLERIKFTLPVINLGANVVFLATGSGKADGMKLIFCPESSFGDIPAELVAPYKGNLVWFRQTDRQMEAGVNSSTSAGEETPAVSGSRFCRRKPELTFVCSTEQRGDTFHWQEDIGSIYRPSLEEVERHVKLFPISSDQRKVVLDHARNGLEYENVWNWEKAITHYHAMDAELGSKHLQDEDEEKSRSQSYLWLHTWASVPILWFKQFVKGGFQLTECIAGWEALRNQWAPGSAANLSMRQHQALALLDLSHFNRSCVELGEKQQAAAVDLFVNERLPLDDQFMETLPRMSFNLFHHYYEAWNVAKAKQWLQTALDNLANDADALLPRVVLHQHLFDLLQTSGSREIAQDLMRKLEGELDNRKVHALKNQAMPLLRHLSFSMLVDRFHTQRGVTDKAVEYAFKSAKKDNLSTPETFDDCVQNSGYLFVGRRFKDALKCLDSGLEMLSSEGLHNRQRRLALNFMANCYLELWRTKPEAKLDSQRTLLPSRGRNFLQLVDPYLQNADGYRFRLDAAKAEFSRIALLESDIANGLNDAYLGNAISCFRKSLTLSSGPDGRATDRLDDLGFLGSLLAAREAVLLMRDEPLEVHLKAWNEAWSVLQKYVELSGRLLHACWEPLHRERMASEHSNKVFEILYALLARKMRFVQMWFYRAIGKECLMVEGPPAMKMSVVIDTALEDMFREFCAKYGEIDCSPTEMSFRKLICSERGRARTLLLEGPSKTRTTAARYHFLQFSLDDEMATQSLQHSISACGMGSVFVSFDVFQWNIWITVYGKRVSAGAPDFLRNLPPDIELEEEHSLILRQILQKTLELLSSQWLSSRLEANSRQLDEYLEQLYEILVQPIEPFLEDMRPEQKLIFCASKDLTSVPFPILRNRETGRYLFQDYTISVTPSLRVLHPCSQRYEALQQRPLAAGKAAGFVMADPKYPNEESKQPIWSRLKGSCGEANTICSLFSHSEKYQVENIQRENATVENLLNRAQFPSKKSSQGFIHIAAHAKVDEKLYPRGVLVLSEASSEDSSSDDDDDDDDESDSDGDEDEDGLQNTRGVAAPGSAFGEVAAGVSKGGSSTSKVASRDDLMTIDADSIVNCGFEWCAALVVLSACDSVNGQLYPEGVHNLPRAFMIAGVPCVVVSQWKVSDETAPKLMEIFYTSLREGNDVASAMRFAMCQMLERKHCLYHFAPFLVWGLPTVCLPIELQLKPFVHGKSISQEVPFQAQEAHVAVIKDNGKSIQTRLSNEERALITDLVKSLSDHKNPCKQEAGAFTPHNVPPVTDIKVRISSEERALAGEVKSLSETNNSRLHHGEASCSDSKWETMLPPSYADILAEAQDAPPSTSSKKQIYDFFCNRVLLRNGTQEYWLDRASGGICLSIGARGLTISWSDVSHYWDWIHLPQRSRFNEVAYLKQVCWLETKGSLQCSLYPGTYTLSWRLYYQSVIDIDPLKFSLEVTGNEPVNTQCRLTAGGARVSMHHCDGWQQFLAWRRDPFGWMEVDVGEFSVVSKDSPVEVKFSMRETQNNNWKSGLYLNGIVIRPSFLIPKNLERTACVRPIISTSATAAVNTQGKSAAAESSSADNSTQVVHQGVQCDECGMVPIEGPRFKCSTRLNYDLCHSCFEKNDCSATEYSRIDQPVVLRPSSLIPRRDSDRC